MTTYCITFAQKYRREIHPVDSGIDPDGYCTLEAENDEEATYKAFNAFNAYYNELFSVDQLDPKRYPLGCLYSV